MIMMVREQEIRAQGREEGRVVGREEGRKEYALTTYKRLLAMNMPEAQARAIAFGEDEEEDIFTSIKTNAHDAKQDGLDTRYSKRQ